MKGSNRIRLSVKIGPLYEHRLDSLIAFYEVYLRDVIYASMLVGSDVCQYVGRQ
jgi:hypothetical protein